MTELETLKRAKMYIDKLSKGVNPIDNTLVNESDIINNVRISKCLCYVSNILEKTIEDKSQSVTVTRKSSVILYREEYTNCWFEFSMRPITIERITKKINENAHVMDIPKVSKAKVRNWLIKMDLLCRVNDCEGIALFTPTEKGAKLGISVKKIRWTNGGYNVVLCDINAQKFIVDNIFKILYF